LSFDKYGDGQDPYCYPGTSVLKNRFDLRNDEDLREVELYISTKAAERLEFQNPPYSLDTLKTVHHTLFSDLYNWAGKIRTVKISKSDSQFCVPERIEPEASKIFASMASENWFENCPRSTLINSIAESYGNLNVVHPFREGNGRSQRILFEWIIVNAGYEINWWAVVRDEWIEANIASYYGDDGRLKEIFNRCLGSPIKEF